MYSMKEKYRQNTKLKSSTSSYSTSRHRYNDDEYSERHSRKTDAKQDRHRSPGMTKQDKYYELLKRDKREPRYSDDFERRAEKRSSRAIDSKYSRDDHGHHRSRADHRDRDHEYKTKSGNARDREYSGERKNSVFAHLSQAVRKVRESRHNGKTEEEDEKNSKRWGHSGYKELYHGDRGDGNNHSRPRKDESAHRNEHSRNFSHSRSRSPIGKSSTRKILAPARRQEQAGLKTDQRKTGSSATNPGGRSEKIASKPGSSLRTPVKKSLPSSSASGTKGSASKGKDKDRDDDESDIAIIRKLREEREKLLALSKKPAGATLSDSRSSDSEAERMPKPSAKVRPFGKSASRSRSRSRSGSRSDSFSSSSHSSDDEDVLELHPTKRRKTSSKTNSSSSDYDSRSESSAISCLASNSGKRSPVSVSSSSSSSFSTGSRHSAGNGKKSKPDRQVNVVPTGNKSLSKPIIPDTSVVTNIIHGRKKSDGKSASKRAKTSGGKASNGATKGQSSKTAKSTAAKSSTAKQAEGKKGSESDSESSSDSDGEPKMSLSERFAKLTQLHTDKREFAKPVLSVNEIDTKMKVVRDLRNPDARDGRILIDGEHASPDNRRRSRPKTPDIIAAEGGRYSSSDRRRHFERMDRDEPSERPADWNDPRVRYTYYRDRGYFNERPLEFEEYVKWEKWWFEYRDWLASEGYYERAAAAAAAAQQVRRPGVDARGPSGWHYDRGPGHRGRPLFDARERLGRPSGVPHPVHAPMADGRPPFMPMDGPRNPNRSIGHGQDGSLVINVRRGSNLGFGGPEYGYRGRGRGPRPY